MSDIEIQNISMRIMQLTTKEKGYERVKVYNLIYNEIKKKQNDINSK